MNAVMIIPTGIGCEIGGHAGDANPVCKLIASVCDKLIIHPNVVNASDINEMPDNCLYVEGSLLDRFLRGLINLEKVKNNKILVVVNKPVRKDTINAVSAGRVTLGIKAEILELETPLIMNGWFEDGRATGEVLGWKELVYKVKGMDFDAMAIHTPINVPRETALSYFRDGGINPWGGVEAKASKLIAQGINKPVAHAPVENTSPDDEELYFIFNEEKLDPRMAPEAISSCYLQCVLKGLHKAPRVSMAGLSVADIDCLISPYGCIGEPHYACFDRDIPIIVVEENKTIFNYREDRCIYVKNYLEAVGVVTAIKEGISIESLTRPFPETTVLRGQQ